MSIPAPVQEMPAGIRDLTFRSLVLGVGMVLVANIGAPYAKYILHSSLMACDYLPFGVMLPFIILVAVINPVLKVLRPTNGLTPGELSVAFLMGLVGSTIPTFGITGYLISTIASPYYYVTTENRWAEYMHPSLPGWLVPTNESKAMTWFFEGLPSDQSLPWEVWLAPLVWWLSFIAALLIVCLSLVVILRKQWIERERIVFPLAQVPLTMVEASDRPGRLPAFMQDRIFWFGFALPLGIILWNMVGHFVPTFPTFPLRNRVQIIDGVRPLVLNIYFPLIGFAYLIHLDVAFSIWFFHLLGLAQVALYDRFGFQVGPGDVYCSSSVPMAWQGFGGFVVMVGWGLWMGRDHLRDVCRKAFGRAPEVDDRQELMSYRMAVWGMLAGLLYMVVFLHATGMAFHVIVTFLFGVFVLYLGVTRIVIEGGLVFLRGPMIAQHFTAYTLGVSSLSPASMTGLALSYTWFCDVKSFFMPAVAHAVKLGDVLQLRRKAILAGVGIALCVGIAASMGYTLYMGYQLGAYNYGDWIFRRGSETPYDAMVKKMQNPFGTDWRRLELLGAGVQSILGKPFLIHDLMDRIRTLI